MTDWRGELEKWPRPIVDVPFDIEQRREILLTLSQSLLGMLLLSNMSFHIVEAAGIFLLWLAQFLVPHWREEVAVAYAVWIVVLSIGFVIKAQPLRAPAAFWETMRRRDGGRGRRRGA